MTHIPKLLCLKIITVVRYQCIVSVNLEVYEELVLHSSNFEVQVEDLQTVGNTHVTQELQLLNVYVLYSFG